MTEEQFSNLFIGPIYGDKFPLSDIDRSSYDEIMDLSDRFCIPSQVLNNLAYDKKIDNTLIKGLQRQTYIANLKKLINGIELLKISKLYNENGIDYVFLKGAAINALTNEYSRHSRDIDILVSKKSLTKAYNILKNIGYTYLNPLVSDRCKYINQSHHLPILSNGDGALVEIHHRVTKKLIYEECPLTELMLEQHLTIIKNKEIIKISNINHLIAHIVYHAAFQNKFNSGPMFLYDINFLKSKIVNKKNLDDLLQKMNLIEAYKDIKDYIDNRITRDSFRLYEISNIKIQNKKKLKDFKYLFFTKEGRSDFLNIISEKLKNNEDSFQTSKYSIKFYIILFKQLKNHIIKTSKI